MNSILMAKSKLKDRGKGRCFDQTRSKKFISCLDSPFCDGRRFTVAEPNEPIIPSWYNSMSSTIRIPLVSDGKGDSLSPMDNNHALPQRATSPSQPSSRIPSPPGMEQSRLRISRLADEAMSRAFSSNHDSPKPRRKGKEFRNDTYLHCNLVTEQQEIPSSSSPVVANVGRTVDRAEIAGDSQFRNPPMKREQLIRIPTQVTALKQKALTHSAHSATVTCTTCTSHITQDNTANSFSTKTGNQKTNSSMAVLPCSTEACANSSTTDSSASSPSSAIASPSKATSCSENMTAAGKVVEKAQCHIRSETNDNRIALASQQEGISQALSPPLITTNATTISRKQLFPETEIVTGQKPNEEQHETIPNASTAKNENTAVTTTENNRVQPAKSLETPAMSIIKASVVQQAVSSASAAAFPSLPIKTALTGNANSNNRNKTLTSPPTKKKKPSSGNKRKRNGSSPSASQKTTGQSSGRWTQEEHQAFLEGLTECGREWKKVALRIPTRTSAQIRSHAQKYFAKLQRDQESSATNPNVGYIHADVTAPLTPVVTGLVLGVGGLTGTIITSPGASALPLSVQRNVERIVSNPRAAQREVEDTMEALRERYRQLQQRLEERRRNREAHKSRREQQKSLASASTNTASFASPLRQNQLNGSPMNRNQLPTNQRKLSSSPTGDDGSSVSSSVSSIAASRTDLGNEEIIALQVLGDTLPRSESTNDLQNQLTEKENNISN